MGDGVPGQPPGTVDGYGRGTGRGRYLLPITLVENAAQAGLAADLENDGDVGINDFLLLLANWG